MTKNNSIKALQDNNFTNDEEFIKLKQAFENHVKNNELKLGAI